MPLPPWPKHPDGRNKTIGEMTRAEKAVQYAASVGRLSKEFSDPVTQAAFASALEKELP